MRSKALVKTECQRCGREILTAANASFANRPWYRRFGGICSVCLSEDEKNELSAEKVRETNLAARRFRIPGRIDWKSEKFPEDEGEVLRFMAQRYFYTKQFIAAATVMDEYPDLDVTEILRSLEEKGKIQALC
ncbi:MAG: hypothetical protein EHM32_08100 [Spirochaetales bacterium]|nr:MAG: hypothetical protein EHM32_08100 [Spirochaetales bacterium]